MISLIFWYVFISFLSLYALWVFYLAVMNLKRVKDQNKLVKWAYWFGMPVLIIGYALDVIVNYLVMTALFLEPPKKLETVTSRLKRHKKDTGWRGLIVAWFEPMLDPFDPSGDHV